MNRLEELLLILSEECAEVSQAAAKCIRFGMESEYRGVRNFVQLENELGDFMAMFKLILEESNLREDFIMAAAEAKLVKVEQFMSNGKVPVAPAVISKPHRRGKHPRKTR